MARSWCRNGTSSRACSMGSPPVISTRPPDGRKALDFGEDLGVRHFMAAGEGVLGVAPGAAEIASGEADEDAGESGERAFTLQRFVDFDDVHGAPTDAHC